MSRLAKLKRGVGWGVGATITLGLIGGVLYLSYQLAGPIATIAYTVLFLVSATFVPTLVFLKVPPMLGFLKNLFGKSHFVLGQVAYGVGVLVQGHREWHLRPGRKRNGAYEVYLNGEWQPIDDDGNVSILGWKPFIVTTTKDEYTFDDVRVDDEFEQRARDQGPSAADIANTDVSQLVQDGGGRALNEGVERGGFEERPITAADLSEDTWLVDLKRLYARGLEQVGDINLIEKAEEITMRNDARSGVASGWEVQIGLAVGLLIGVATGYVMTAGG